MRGSGGEGGGGEAGIDGARRRLAGALLAGLLLAIPTGCAGQTPDAGREAEADDRLSTADFADRLVREGLDSARARIVAEGVTAILDSAESLPGYEAWAESADATGDEAAFAFGQLAGLQGVVRLPDEELDAWTGLQGRTLELLSDAECARYSRADVDPSFLVQIWGRLDADDLRRLIQLNGRAGLAHLASDAPPATPSREEAEGAFGELLGAMSPAQERQFLQAVDAPEPTDVESCRMATLLWATLPELTPENKRILLRAMAR